MFKNRSAVALYGVALLMLGCSDDGGPTGPEGSSISASSIKPEPSDDEGDKEAQSEDGPTKEEDPPIPEPEEPDEIGLPCAVKTLLATHCQGCHGVDAKNGTPLLTHADLLATSKKDPATSVAARALLRVTATDKPMPPMGKGEPLSEADVQTLKDWVEQGAEAGSCASE